MCAPAAAARAAGPVIVVLSAHEAARLQEQVAQLQAAVQSGRFTDADLPALAYTLQVGREAMAERVGLLVTTLAELQAGLQAVLEGRAVRGVYRGQARKADDVLALLTTDSDFREVVERWVEQGRADKLVELWIKGVTIEWSRLYRDGAPRRLSLPTYPFARQRCWVPSSTATGDHTASTSPTRRSDAHSVVTLSTTLSGRESYLTDHAVHGRSLLPAVVYLEMAREAVSRTCGAPLLGRDAPSGTVRLNGVVWTRPCYADAQAVRLDLRLESHPDGEMTFEIASPGAPAGASVIHARGRAAVDANAPRPSSTSRRCWLAAPSGDIPPRRVTPPLRTWGAITDRRSAASWRSGLATTSWSRNWRPRRRRVTSRTRSCSTRASPIRPFRRRSRFYWATRARRVCRWRCPSSWTRWRSSARARRRCGPPSAATMTHSTSTCVTRGARSRRASAGGECGRSRATRRRCDRWHHRMRAARRASFC